MTKQVEKQFEIIEFGSTIKAFETPWGWLLKLHPSLCADGRSELILIDDEQMQELAQDAMRGVADEDSRTL